MTAAVPLGSFFPRLIVALPLSIAILILLRALYRIDPKVFDLWVLSFQLGSRPYYDPLIQEDQHEFPTAR